MNGGVQHMNRFSIGFQDFLSRTARRLQAPSILLEDRFIWM